MEFNRSHNISEETSQDLSMDYMGLRVAKITFYAIIFLLSFVGNSLVAAIILGARDMRSPPNFLILNLALCDLIIPTVDIPFDLALEESKYIWRFGKALCKIIWPLETAFTISSSLTLAVISLERLKAISHPFTKRLQMRHVFVAITVIYTFSVSLCIPYLIALNYEDNQRSCDESWPNYGSRQAYTIVLCLCEYVFPLTIMVVAYVFIYRSLRSNFSSLLQSNSVHETQLHEDKAQSSTIKKGRVEYMRKEQNTRLARMFVIVVIVFAISTLPNQALWLWVDFGNGNSHKSFRYISVACRLCTYANSVLNPFIYALKSKDFRSGFNRIGRAGIHPFRKINSGTRKFANKINKSASDNQRSVQEHMAPQLFPLQHNQHYEMDELKIISEGEARIPRRNQKTNHIIHEDMSIDSRIPDIPLYANLLKELRETDS
ncbi:galanin receptor type 1-like [Montipora foliosa]|uniref:galanin receptor type 1-like n=1 Tax=Montipora foliosa TaxID=591990 RepID=UPI0035F16DC7